MVPYRPRVWQGFQEGYICGPLRQSVAKATSL